MPEKLNPHASPAAKMLNLYGLLLFSGRQYSLPQLAKMLRCSKQTVLRMLEQIEMSRTVMVESWREGRRKWIRVKTPPVPPRVCLDARAIQLLLLCRDFVCHLLPPELREEVDQTIARTATLLSDPATKPQALTPLGQAYARGVVDYSAHQELVNTLLQAMTERRICRVRYHSPRQPEPREYAVAPLFFLSHYSSLYVRCWRMTEDGPPEIVYDNMLLAVQRLLAVTPTERTFSPPELPPESSHRFGLMQGDPFRVRLKVSPAVAAYVRERCWSDDQSLTPQPDGGLLVEFTATSRPEVVSWVLSFGPEAELLAPADLRAEVADLTRRMAAKYAGDRAG
ncbi:MAG: WYL domain-containing protein [Syntrophobacterales bacterium]|nr:WYL domain-containing protein [Syntrophobacterales bacterium]